MSTQRLSQFGKVYLNSGLGKGSSYGLGGCQGQAHSPEFPQPAAAHGYTIKAHTHL